MDLRTSFCVWAGAGVQYKTDEVVCSRDDSNTDLSRVVEVPVDPRVELNLSTERLVSAETDQSSESEAFVFAAPVGESREPQASASITVVAAVEETPRANLQPSAPPSDAL